MDGEKPAPGQHVAGALARFASVVRGRFGESVVDIRLFGSHARANAHFVVGAAGACEELEAARAFVETVRGQMKAGADE